MGLVCSHFGTPPMTSPVVEIKFTQSTMGGSETFVLKGSALASIHNIPEVCALHEKNYRIRFMITCQPIYYIDLLHEDGKVDGFYIYGTAQRGSWNFLEGVGILPACLTDFFCDVYELFQQQRK